VRQPRDHTRGLSRRGPVNRTTLRLRELERIISLRFPIGILPTSKEADVYLLQAAKLLRRNLHDRKGFPTRAEVLERLAIWAERWAHFTSTEHLEQIANHALQQPGIEKADELGKLLALTFEERQLLKITTIGACDVNSATRAPSQTAKARTRQRTSSPMSAHEGHGTTIRVAQYPSLRPASVGASGNLSADMGAAAKIASVE
jgi:hypothetical protein